MIIFNVLFLHIYRSNQKIHKLTYISFIYNYIIVKILLLTLFLKYNKYKIIIL